MYIVRVVAVQSFSPSMTTILRNLVTCSASRLPRQTTSREINSQDAGCVCSRQSSKTNLTTDQKPAVIETITDIDQNSLKINEAHRDLVEIRPLRFMGQRAAKPVLPVPGSLRDYFSHIVGC